MFLWNPYFNAVSTVSEYGHFNRITGDAEESIPFNVLFTGEGSLKLGGCDY